MDMACYENKYLIFHFWNCGYTWIPSIYCVTCVPRIHDGRRHYRRPRTTQLRPWILNNRDHPMENVSDIYSSGQWGLFASMWIWELKDHHDVHVNITTLDTTHYLGWWSRYLDYGGLTVYGMVTWVTVVSGLFGYGMNPMKSTRYRADWHWFYNCVECIQVSCVGFFGQPKHAFDLWT